MTTFAKTAAEALKNSTPHHGARRDAVVLTRGSELTPKPINWLWRGWLARGKFHVLAGAPGQGKTTIAIACAATVTSAGRWPDGSRCPSGNVLIWSGEDDPADTLAPRLIAAGADLGRIYFVVGARINGEVLPFDPSRDLVSLTEQAEKIGDVHLVVVDPVVSAVAGDSHKNTEVRRALQPLVDLGAYLNAAVLGISHFSKGTGGRDPIERVTGSVAFGAVARVVLVAAKTKGEDGEPDRRVFARAKSNIGPDNGGFQYQIEQVEALPGIEASRITWGQALEGTARELLTEPDEEQGDDGEDACDLLRAELVSDTWTPADTACKPLREAGFTKKQIWAASKKLFVIRKKRGMGGGWYWRLPGSNEAAFTVGGVEDSAEGSEGSNILNGDSSESSKHLESSSVAERKHRSREQSQRATATEFCLLQVAGRLDRLLSDT